MAAPSSAPEPAPTAVRTPSSRRSSFFPSSKAFGRSTSLFGTATLSPSTISSEAERFSCTRFSLKASTTLLGHFRPNLADTLAKSKSSCTMQLQIKSINQAPATLHLHLPICQHQLLHSLLILILLQHPPTHHLLILLPPIHHIPLQILTIQLDHTHRWHPQPHTHRLPQLTHPIPHIHLPIHSTPTLYRLPIHPPPILLHIPIRLLQLIHHLRIHRLQVTLLEYTLHRHTDEDLLHLQPRKQRNVACTSLYNPIPALLVIRNPVFCFVSYIFPLSSLYSIHLFCHGFIIYKTLAKVCQL